MLTISLEKDSERLRSILTSPYVRKGIVEAGYEDSDYLEPIGSTAVFFNTEEGYDGGCALIRVLTSRVVELHTCLLPSVIGRSNEAFNLLVDFLRKNTNINQIITWVPVTNRLAEKAAKVSGFTKICEVPRSFVTDKGEVSSSLYRFEITCQH